MNEIKFMCWRDEYIGGKWWAITIDALYGRFNLIYSMKAKEEYKYTYVLMNGISKRMKDNNVYYSYWDKINGKSKWILMKWGTFGPIGNDIE